MSASSTGEAYTLSSGMSKKPWIWSAWMSTVSTRSVPTTSIIWAATFAVIGTRAARSLRSWRAYPKYGITAVTLAAEARFSASTSTSSSIRFSADGAQVDCITNTSWLRTFSSISTCTSPSENLPTTALPSGSPSVCATSSASLRLALPENSIRLDVLCMIPVSRLQRQCGWGGRIRTCECRDQNPVPYHLATPHCRSRPGILPGTMNTVAAKPRHVFRIGARRPCVGTSMCRGISTPGSCPTCMENGRSETAPRSQRPSPRGRPPVSRAEKPPIVAAGAIRVNSGGWMPVRHSRGIVASGLRRADAIPLLDEDPHRIRLAAGVHLARQRRIAFRIPVAVVDVPAVLVQRGRQPVRAESQDGRPPGRAQAAHPPRQVGHGHVPAKFGVQHLTGVAARQRLPAGAGEHRAIRAAIQLDGLAGDRRAQRELILLTILPPGDPAAAAMMAVRRGEAAFEAPVLLLAQRLLAHSLGGELLRGAGFAHRHRRASRQDQCRRRGDDCEPP